DAGRRLIAPRIEQASRLAVLREEQGASVNRQALAALVLTPPPFRQERPAGVGTEEVLELVGNHSLLTVDGADLDAVEHQHPLEGVEPVAILAVRHLALQICRQ